MANADPRDVLKVPGQLCINPTDLSVAFPHGGTALGLVARSRWVERITTRPIMAEEYGTAVVVLKTVREPVFRCVLRGWDRDALEEVFLDTVQGGSTGQRVVRGRVKTDRFRAGAVLSSSVMFFSPDNSQHPGLLLFAAVAYPEDVAEINFSLASEVQIAAAWRATPNSLGRDFEVSPRGNLTL